jgi:hypothetical protein
LATRAQAERDGQGTTEIDIGKLTERFNETASYDVSEDRVRKNLEYFKKLIDKEKLIP